MDIRVQDILVMKKAHPCGDKRWEVLRTGMDFRLRCLGCGHELFILIFYLIIVAFHKFIKLMYKFLMLNFLCKYLLVINRVHILLFITKVFYCIISEIF